MNPRDPHPERPADPDTGPDAFLTLADAGEAEFKEQRSRFIGRAVPARDEAAARAAVADMARRFHDCRHVCWAWRLGVPPDVVESRNDAGEPAGTAGEPILAEIRKRDLAQVVVVVARYFGGVKLGTGGLARAYGRAAAAALAAAPERTVRLGRRFGLDLPYGAQKTVRHLLERHGGEIVAEDYGTGVRWTIWLANSRWEAFEAALTESSAGALRLLPEAPDGE